MRIKGFVSFFWISVSFLYGQQGSDPMASTLELRVIESRHYVEYAYLTPLPTLLALPQNASKDSIIVAHSTQPHHRVGGASTDPNAWLQELIGNSDAVLVGRPYNRVSALTAEKTFVFSDYEFAVHSVLKDNTNRLSSGSRIVVSRPGGEVSYEGKSLRAIDPQFHLFQLGELYILFLYRIPETGTYMVTSERAFSVQAEKVSPASTSPLHTLSSTRDEDFISLIHSYVLKEGPKK